MKQYNSKSFVELFDKHPLTTLTEKDVNEKFSPGLRSFLLKEKYLDKRIEKRKTYYLLSEKGMSLLSSRKIEKLSYVATYLTIFMFFMVLVEFFRNPGIAWIAIVLALATTIFAIRLIMPRW